MSAEFAGVAKLAPGDPVEFRNVGPWFAGEWTAETVQHRFDPQAGFRTQIVATPQDTVSLRNATR